MLYFLPTPGGSGNIFSILVSPHLVEWYIDIYLSIYGVDLSYSEIILKFNEYLKRLVNRSSFDTFSTVVMSIGIMLMLFYFFSDLTEKATVNQLSMLQMGKSVSVAVGSLFVIFHTKQIFIFMLSFVETLNKDLASLSPPGIKDVTTFLSNDIVRILLGRSVSYHFSVFEIIGYTLLALFLMLISLVAKIYITYQSATRILQLFVYYIFAPIGVADIFENGPGGTINWSSSGFRYIKNIFSIMLQVLVITLTCHAFSLVATSINMWYLNDKEAGIIENLYDEGGEEDDADTSTPDADDSLTREKVENATKKINESALYPLLNFEYTKHSAGYKEIDPDLDDVDSEDLEDSEENVTQPKKSGKNKVLEWLLNLILNKKGDPEEDGDWGITAKTAKKLRDAEIHKVTAVVDLDGTILKPKVAKRIRKNSKYRMTVESTKEFFYACTGSDGSKMILFIVLILTKVLMVSGSAKLCGYLTGTST